MAQRPMYQQIAEDLRAQMKSGVLKPGAQLPTELELRDRYNSSRNTIRDAIKRLTSLGLVETRPGQGTFVTRRIDPFVTVLNGDPKSGGGGGESTKYLSEVNRRNRRADLTTPRVELRVPPAEITRRLRVPPDTQAVIRHEQRFIDDIPWSLQTSFYPMDFVTKGAVQLLIADHIEGGAVHYLAETIDVRQVGYRDWITARVPDGNEQSFFELAHDATVFEIFRIGFDETGMPLRVTVTVFPADRNQFIVNIGKVPDPEYLLADEAEQPGEAEQADEAEQASEPV